MKKIFLEPFYFNLNHTFLCIIYLISNCSFFFSLKIAPYPNPGFFYTYSKKEEKQQNKEHNEYFKYFNYAIFNPYHQFIIDSNYLLNKDASKIAIEKFEDLYDNKCTRPIWENFTNLNKDLTQTKLSETVTLKIDWNNLISQTGLNSLEIRNIDFSLLRFYNIISKIYQKTNILRLLQYVEYIGDYKNSGITEYSPRISAAAQFYNQEFVNQTKINENYNLNLWSSKSILAVIAHEYAHALSFYMQNNNQQRSSYNTYKAPSNDKDRSFYLNHSFEQKVFNNSERVFHDVTDNFCTFLNNISGTNFHDKVEQMIFPFLVVNSRYSQIAWIENQVYLREELFAEGFSRWINTPKDERNFAWEILNNYFLSYLPQYYNLN